MGTPSTTSSGVLEPKTDLLPRSIILEAPPAPPALGVITTPDTFPSIELATFGSCTLFRSSLLICCVAYVRDFSLRMIPIAVTTTSFSTWLSSFRVTLISVLPLTTTVCEVYPMYENINSGFSVSMEIL